MKTTGWFRGPRSKRWLGTALVLGAALAVLAAGRNAPASGGKNKPCTECVDSLVFSDNGSGTPITIPDPNMEVPRWATPGEPHIFCFENRTSCDITVTFPGDSPFNRKAINLKKGETKGLEFNSDTSHSDPHSKKSTYSYKYPDSCSKGTTAGAKMIVQP